MKDWKGVYEKIRDQTLPLKESERHLLITKRVECEKHGLNNIQLTNMSIERNCTR